jgi:uncharacterized Ntn-hydrolase superfamily protein
MIVATYSIAACDLDAGQWGVATQSKFLAVGSVVPWAEPGAGAVATQAYANPRYGPDGLALLREGTSADEVVEQLTRADGDRDHRQLGVVDARGGSATFTGSACMEWAGGLAGPGFAAQGNILVGEETVAALATTFTASDGLPLVVEKDGGYASLSDVLVDLRVDDHAQPVAELARLYAMHRLLFGKTEQWVEVDDALRDELRERLHALGYDGELEQALSAWAGTENLEERLDGVDHIDPVVLAELRAR